MRLLKNRGRVAGLSAGAVMAVACGISTGQPPLSPVEAQTALTEAGERASAEPRVPLTPRVDDGAIRERLERIYDATGWFEGVRLRVDEGVVFLEGVADTSTQRRWAVELAGRTEGVAGVVNAMDVRSSAWDFSAAQDGLRTLWDDALRALPLLMLGLVILVLAALAASIATRGARRVLAARVDSRLLRGLLSRGAGVMVFIAGLYIVLRISGLTQLALTVVGGTGLIGLAVGIAFRDITENYLASIFLSVQRPFRTGDLVEINEVVGYVRQLNVRTTVVMTLNGSTSQLPNSTVYRSVIRNYTTNPNRREDFMVGIGYDDNIAHAQEVARGVLSAHPAVLNDPEPWVLAEDLGRATVNLRIYFWLNGHEHSWLKVRSSVIRLIKRAFQENGISMPDEAREVIFPKGVPVRMLGRAEEEPSAVPAEESPRTPDGPEVVAASEVATPAEVGLFSEAGMLDQQARQSNPLNESENLLRDGAQRGPGKAGPG